MVEIPRELLAVAGLGVIGFIGETILVELGRKPLAVFWSVILSIAAGVISIKYFMDGTERIAHVFGIYF